MRGACHCMAGLAQQSGDHRGDGSVVLDQQDAPGIDHGFGALLTCNRGMAWRLGKRQAHGEDRTLSWRRVQLDTAAHQRGQFPADRQAQAEAMGTLPRPRLFVTLEQALAIVRGDARTCVGDGEYKTSRPIVTADRYVSMLGE